VKKDKVDRQGDGSRGLINADRTAVKAASVDGPGESYRRQVDLNKGDDVEIVAEEGDYYRIKSPKRAYVFVRVASVRREELLPATAEIPKVESPVVDAPVPPSIPVVKVETPVAPVVTVEKPVAPVVAIEKPVAPTVTVEKPTTPTVAVEKPAVTVPPEFVKPLIVVEGPTPPVAPSVPMAVAKPRADVTTPTVVVEAPAAVVAAAAVVGDPVPAAPVAVEAPAPTADVTHAMPATVTPAVVVTTTEPMPVVAAAPPSISLAALEARYEAAQKLPLEDQPIAELLAGYQAKYVAGDLGAQDSRLVALRIARLRRNAQLAQTLREISQVRETIHDVTPTASSTASRRVEYDAVGQLVASGVYDGINLPRLFRLVSPTLRTIAYVRPSSEIDTLNMLGQIVGVNGTSRYDPALKLSVLEADKIETLKAESTGVSGALGAVTP